MAIMMSASSLSAQSYSELWKQAEAAAKKDLPKTQMEVLEKIVKKAKKEKAYGHLLKAQLGHANLQMKIAPDSLKPVMERLEQQTAEAEKKDPALGAVMDAVMASAYKDNSELGEDSGEKSQAYFKKVFSNVSLLANTPANRFKPLVEEQADSKIFNDDLLSLLGLHAAGYGYSEAYRLMHDYYDQQGNRLAAMYTANEMGQDVDSLIARYQDLSECGYLAERKLSSLTGAEKQIEYANYALKTWPNYRNANHFLNIIQHLTLPSYHAYVERCLSIPSQTCKVKFHDLRNIQWLTMRISNADTKKEVNTQTHHYTGKKAYEIHTDSMTIPALPLGNYKIDFKTNESKIESETIDYHVSNITVISENIPNDATRYVVVNATTGKPIPGAKMSFRIRERHDKPLKTVIVTANAKGECEWKNENYVISYYAYTAEDHYMPKNNSGWGRYTYYEPRSNQNVVNIYTDRSLYRPGQTVHASVLAFNNKKGVEVKAIPNMNVTLSLRDANGKVVSEESLTTDSYGSASADFQLPSSGLTGMFSLRTDNGGYQSFRVEEYKRPTFEVEFDEVKVAYKAGDTVNVRGTTKSFAGVPVQGAKVKYTVKRRRALWWWGRNDNGAIISEGEAVTDAEGAFEVPVFLDLDEDLDEENSWAARYYHFEVQADVTDQAGESHDGNTYIPIGTRPTALNVDIPEKVLKGTLKTVRFSRHNAAGKEIDGDVTYSIDGRKSFTVKANTELSTTNKTYGFSSLSSGEHLLKATCGEDTLEKKFVIFSLDDKCPPVETPDWFYQNGSEFGDKPVSVIVGSSEKDVTVYYSVFSGSREIDHGTFLISNSNRRFDYTYKAEYGSGLLINYAWIKNGMMYTHRAVIRKPLPDKRLITKWTTFRDRLTPGQKETWTLQVTHPDGTPAKAQLLATLFDKSLDDLYKHDWNLSLGLYQNLPNTYWSWNGSTGMGVNGYLPWQELKTVGWNFSHFSDEFRLECISPRFYRNGRVLMAKAPMAAGTRANVSMQASDDALQEVVVMGSAAEKKTAYTGAVVEDRDEVQEAAQEEQQPSSPQIRENLNETAFFYPAVETDAEGNISLRFTLPESVTTWRFIGLAHDAEMNNAITEAETVAKKDVMVQPNVPRFIREGDVPTLSTRIINTTDHAVSGTAKMLLLDPETEQTVYEQSVPFTVNANETSSASFTIDLNKVNGQNLYICRVLAEGTDFSDGEQHYLPLLPNKEQVTNTLPFTQNGPGTKEIALSALVPSVAMESQQTTFTVEYTNSPAWLMVQALPFVSKANEENAISLAASYYVNSLGQYILSQSPKIKNTFAQWQQEKGRENSMQSALEKNQELKNLVLDETPWVSEARQESDQKKALANFFNENSLEYQMNRALEGLRRLQLSDGSFSWWKGMKGSPVMTAEVLEFLTRLNLLTTTDTKTRNLLDKAHDFLGKVVVKEVKEFKEREKQGKPVYINDYHALQWLYVCAVDHRTLSKDETAAKEYLLKYLEKQKLKESIYAKALMTVILAKNGEQAKAKEYLQSLMEYTVYTEEKGRYYDTPRAGYSWCDYRIPTQTAVIEALQLVNPSDEQRVNEMRRWILQEKRTQAWDTPVNSVNAVFAFLNGNTGILAAQEPTVLKLDGKPMETPQATAGLGYVKVVKDNPGALQNTIFTSEKTSQGTSWGALYMQFMQPVTDVEDASSGMKVTREIVGGNRELKVGDRIKIRLTIEADRDYDFVQLVDKRAACLEPVQQLSGYHWSYYIAPKDHATNYYFDVMAKGTHIIETEYYVDREGTYQTGVCTVQCAYAPEYTARTKAMVIKVKK